jgi:hypothetical protein
LRSRPSYWATLPPPSTGDQRRSALAWPARRRSTRTQAPPAGSSTFPGPTGARPLRWDTGRNARRLGAAVPSLSRSPTWAGVAARERTRTPQRLLLAPPPTPR